METTEKMQFGNIKKWYFLGKYLYYFFDSLHSFSIQHSTRSNFPHT